MPFYSQPSKPSLPNKLRSGLGVRTLSKKGDAILNFRAKKPNTNHLLVQFVVLTYLPSSQMCWDRWWGTLGRRRDTRRRPLGPPTRPWAVLMEEADKYLPVGTPLRSTTHEMTHKYHEQLTNLKNNQSVLVKFVYDLK